MRRLAKILGYLFIVFLWLIVISFALELYERLRWKHIESTNKYIGIRKGRVLYCEWDPEEQKEEYIQYGEGKNLIKPESLLVGDEFCLPPPTPFEKWSHRLSYYLSHGEEVRKCLKYVYGIYECELELDGNSLELKDIVFTDIYDEVKRRTSLSLINSVDFKRLKDGVSVIESVNGSDGKNYLLYLYFRGRLGGIIKYSCFVIPDNSSEKRFNPFLENIALNEIYDIPYFCYYPHVSLTASAFRTNNYGFRDYDFVVPKQEEVFRIICIGASTTEEGVSNKETYPKFLESILRSYFNTDKIEVFNCGVSGMTFNGHIAKLPEYTLFQPNMVIIYEGVNNIVYDLFPKMFDKLPVFVRLIYLGSLFARNHLRDYYPFNYAVKEMEKIIDEEYIAKLKVLIDTFTNEGALVAISSVGIPVRNKLSEEERNYMDYYYDKEWGWINSNFGQYCKVMDLWNEKLKDLCEREMLIYIPFAERIPPSTKYFGDICHMRQRGIKLKAQVMAETLIPIIEEILKSKSVKGSSN